MSARGPGNEGAMSEQAETTSVSQYVAPLRTHRKVVGLVALITLAFGVLLALVGPKTYTATTSVLVHPVASEPTEALRTTDRSSDMATETRLAESGPVAQGTVDRFADLAIGVTPATVAANLAVSNPEDSRILDLSYRASDPAVARVGSQLATDAYIAYRAQVNDTAAQAARDSVNEQIAILQDRLVDVEQRYDLAAAGSAARQVIDVERTTIEGELAAQQRALANLSTLATDAISVIDEAREPTGPDGLGLLQLVAGAAAGGLVLGVIVAWLLTLFGVDPGSAKLPKAPKTPKVRRSRSPKKQRDEPADADDPFDDSDSRDPLELLKALDAIEADPKLGEALTAVRDGGTKSGEEPEPTVEKADEESTASFADLYPVEFFDADGGAADVIDDLGSGDGPGDTGAGGGADSGRGAILGLLDGEGAEPAPPTPPAADEVEPRTLAEAAGFDGDPATPPALRGLAALSGPTGDPEQPSPTADEEPILADPSVDPFGAEPELEASLANDPADTDAFDLAPLGDDASDADPFSADPFDGLETSGLDDDPLDRGDLDELDPPSGERDTGLTEFSTWPGDDQDLVDALATPEETAPLDGPPEDLDPGPSSWEEPFAGPTTWDQLTGPDTPPPALAGPPAVASAPSSDSLTATKDLDELFERLGELGRSGPVSVLSLSHRDPTAGLTAGFEMADELRAVGALVLLIDTRLETPALDSLFDDRLDTGLAQVLTGEVVLTEATRTLEGLNGLDLLTVGTVGPDTADALTGPAFERLLSEARLSYHSIVLIGDAVTAEDGDGDPVDLGRTRVLVGMVDAVVVGTPEPIGTPAADDLSQVVASFPVPTIQVIAAPVADGAPGVDGRTDPIAGAAAALAGETPFATNAVDDGSTIEPSGV